MSCPALRGCRSQGKTRKEALANIQEAIRERLPAEEDEAKPFMVSEAEVAILGMGSEGASPLVGGRAFVGDMTFS